MPSFNLYILLYMKFHFFSSGSCFPCFVYTERAAQDYPANGCQWLFASWMSFGPTCYSYPSFTCIYSLMKYLLILYKIFGSFVMGYVNPLSFKVTWVIQLTYLCLSSSVNNFTFLKTTRPVVPFLVWSIKDRSNLNYGTSKICKKDQIFTNLFLYSHSKIKCMVFMSFKPFTKSCEIHYPWFLWRDQFDHIKKLNSRKCSSVMPYII